MKYLLTFLLYLWVQTIAAQNFTAKNTIELGGSMAISYQKGLGDAELGLSYFSFSPYAGFMVLKGFEIGISPTISSYDISSNYAVTELGIYLAPAYNFDIKSNVYPYIELLAGYGMIDNSSYNEDVISWGGHIGLKVAIGASSLLVISTEYLRRTFEVSVDDSYGFQPGNYNLDALSLGVGFRVFFGQHEKKEKS